MASITAYKKGYRIQFIYNSKRYSKVLRTKKECTEWYLSTITELKSKPLISSITFKELIDKYLSTNSTVEHEYVYHFLIRNYPELVYKPINEISKLDINNWIEDRLKKVKPSTLTRNLVTLKKAINFGLDNEYITNNPFDYMKPLPRILPRQRLITQDEIQTILKYSGYTTESDLPLIRNRVGACFIFALETALRAQEITNLTWEDINLEDRIINIKKSKTSTGIREVPLTPKAIEILRHLKRIDFDNKRVFGINKSRLLTSIFIVLKHRAGLSGFTFHDARAYAITNLAMKINILDLARVVGHKRINMLMTYYRKSIKDIAKDLT